ncbi:leucyl aminopeptidase Metallo peptidase. MEROPS family M28E [Lysobacter sp. yr284]|uniref:M20/M25/M40 family metallo-hydrolase n=1 Tax=Lysobacter sp. yr284 TaxID=1761791 RepID=UPI0008982BDA|nr:M20/M25/M40 family metallo-hydrolase [Lysobacter sp. yr284]SDZ29105.1 leucyl aminopeptidase Metallo peptidase. MEROPS family M28E [Lysobacter sp. yr284]
MSRFAPQWLLSLAALAAAPAFASGPADGSSKPVFVVAAERTHRAALAGAGARLSTLASHDGDALAIREVPADRLAELARHVHEKEKRCGGFFAFDSREQAEAFVRDDLSALAVSAQAASYTVDNQATVTPWLAQVREANIRATIRSLSGNWTTRHAASASGRVASDWVRDTWRNLAAHRADVSVEQVACGNCGQQPSVVLTVRGNELPGEVVVLGAHLDSLASGGASAGAPGADDDASGVATLTEVLRVALAGGYKPRRTVKFMAYAAEEIGLRGSNAIASDHRDRGVEVVGVLQLDMTNYRTAGAADLRLVGDNSNAGLQQLVRQLYSRYLGGGALAEYRCGYGCSYHASWTAAGYPAAMLFEGGTATGGYSPHIHTRNDTLANMGNSAANSVPFAKLGLAFLGELGKTSAL